MKHRLGSLLVVLVGGLVHGQSTSSTMTGSVSDSSGGMIAGASVRVTLTSTGAVREIETDTSGTFVLSALTPGVYDLSVGKSGFKRAERKSVNLPPNERLAVPGIQLEIGAISDVVSVTAEGTAVQTESAERSGLVTSGQIQNLTVINRDFSALISLLPGVVASQRGQSVGFGGNATFNVQGNRNSGNNITVDGVPAADLGNATDTTTFISMDSVSEVKILVSSYSPEFGRKPGAAIQAVTKSGTKEFHGSGYWYKRHEQFNANNFFNNRQGLPEPRYRYTTAGLNGGGPVWIPGKFNRDKSKLFFFGSFEFWREARPQDIRQVTTPTAAERAGDFSQSRDTNNAIIPVRDPLAGNTQFPGNIIPANRINRNGQSYLRLLPEPNFFDTQISSRRYNYQFQESLEAPKRIGLFRVDYNAGPKTTMYLRYNHFWEDIRGAAAPGGNSNWGWLPSTYLNTNKTAALALTHIFGPRTVFESQTGVNRATENATATDAAIGRVTRQTANFTAPQLFPVNNPLNLVPRANFNGISQPANPTVENRFPLFGTDTLLTQNAIVTHTRNRHTLKAGAWIERARNIEGTDGVFNGLVDFSRDVNNPLDTNHPYGNAILGNFASYTESDTRPGVFIRSWLAEWFVQDNWKATSRLTIDYGVRFTWSMPYQSIYQAEAGFIESQFNPARAVRLVEPFRNAANQRVGRSPVDGTIFPAAAIGALVPGTGNPTNGSVTSRDGFPRGLRNGSGVKWAPRLGVVWDPFGKGKTAVRAGGGVFFEGREQGTRGFGLWRNPPMRADQVLYYGNLDQLGQLRGVTFPSASSGFNLDWPLTRTYNANFGIQQNVGYGTVVDVSYVGSFGRNLIQGRNVNAIPFGANFAARNQDPTNAGRPLPASFLRPYAGYNDIILYEWAGNSSYHSLQVSGNRRFARGLQFGGAWTWSKAMNYSDTNTATVSNLINPKVWNYSLAGFDRTHVVQVNWMYEAPAFAAKLGWKNGAARQILDGWQISGIGSFISGSPLGVGLGFVNAVDITGSPTDGARVVVVDNPVLPKSERTFSRNFNTAAVRAPAVGTFGNSARNIIRGPGVANWDVSIFKNFQLWERARLQFRSEMYNVFNHTQFSALDTAARFDAAGNQANLRLGEFTAARDPRRIQLALRLTF
jgi:hypothetical protein